MRLALFEELSCFMSSWDITWCLGGDFNVIRFPSERFTDGRSSWAMREFSSFIDSCNVVDPLLEGARFTWSSHEEVSVLSRIDRFLFSIELEEHFQGVHQVTLPKITSNHFPILLPDHTSFIEFQGLWPSS